MNIGKNNSNNKSNIFFVLQQKEAGKIITQTPIFRGILSRFSGILEFICWCFSFAKNSFLSCLFLDSFATIKFFLKVQNSFCTRFIPDSIAPIIIPNWLAAKTINSVIFPKNPFGIGMPSSLLHKQSSLLNCISIATELHIHPLAAHFSSEKNFPFQYKTERFFHLYIYM